MTSIFSYEPSSASQLGFVKEQMASQMYYEPAFAPRAVPSSRDIHEVWEYNIDVEFNALLNAVSRAGGPEAVLGLDTEFPGFPFKGPPSSSHTVHYQALRHNIDKLWPIQLGVAVIGANGVHHGVWSFNLRFDAMVDAHTEESVAFLREAGIDFPRHRIEGVCPLSFGRRLANSMLVGPHGCAPIWVTFAGFYDWGYLLKLVTLGRALPGTPSAFDKVLSVYCPNRRELRDLLPSGSLETLGKRHGVQRWGRAHTAGSDALLTLELFLLLGGDKMVPEGTKLLGEMQEEQWINQITWQNADEWYQESTDPWYSVDIIGQNGGGQAIFQDPDSWENSHWNTDIQVNNKIQTTSLGWGDPSSIDVWSSQSQPDNMNLDSSWFAQSGAMSNAPPWYPSEFQATGQSRWGWGQTWSAAL